MEKRGSYFLKFKLKAISLARNLGSKRKAGKKFKISRKCISNWMKNETSIKQSANQLVSFRVSRVPRAIYLNPTKTWSM